MCDIIIYKEWKFNGFLGFLFFFIFSTLTKNTCLPPTIVFAASTHLPIYVAYNCRQRVHTYIHINTAQWQLYYAKQPVFTEFFFDFLKLGCLSKTPLVCWSKMVFERIRFFRQQHLKWNSRVYVQLSVNFKFLSCICISNENTRNKQDEQTIFIWFGYINTFKIVNSNLKQITR